MRRAKFLAVFVAALGLSSCQPPEYELRPFFKTGLLYFDLEFEGMWPFKWDDSEAEARYFEVVTSDTVLWAIEASDAPGCTTPTANPEYRERTSIRFPLRFGEAPRCFETLAAPKPLPRDRDILVRSTGSVTDGSGAFRIESGTLVPARDAQALWTHAPSRSGLWQAPATQVPGEANAVGDTEAGDGTDSNQAQGF